MLKKLFTVIIIIALFILILFIFLDTKDQLQKNVSYEIEKFSQKKALEYQDTIKSYNDKLLRIKNNSNSKRITNENYNNSTDFSEELAIEKGVCNNVYVIQPGDTLISIANCFNKDYLYLAKINRIKNPNLIYAHNYLRLSK